MWLNDYLKLNQIHRRNKSNNQSIEILYKWRNISFHNSTSTSALWLNCLIDASHDWIKTLIIGVSATQKNSGMKKMIITFAGLISALKWNRNRQWNGFVALGVATAYSFIFFFTFFFSLSLSPSSFVIRTGIQRIHPEKNWRLLWTNSQNKIPTSHFDEHSVIQF